MADESVNQITPRHFVVMMMLSRLNEIKQRIEENDIDRDPTDYFRSQIWVWLQRAKEILEETIENLEAQDD